MLTHDGTDGIVRTDAGDLVLDPAGDVHVASDIKKEYSGNIHPAAPLAYGSISYLGTIESGTGNFTCTWDSPNNRYLIVIDGEGPYLTENYAVSLTPTSAVIGYTGAWAGGEMVVHFRNLSGSLVQSDFQFIVYKP